MQVNMTTPFSYELNLGSAFSIDSANLNITRPDGVVNNAFVTVSPGGSANPQTMSALYTPAIGGMYQGIWQPVISAQTLTFPFTFWVTWTSVYTAIRNMLGMTPQSLPDTKIDYEFVNVYTRLKNFATINDYYNLSTAYQPSIDQGMGKLVSAVIRPYIGGKRPTGEVSLFKKGTTTVQYSIGNTKDRYSLEETWRAEGMDILAALIPEIAAAVAGDRYGDETMTRGDNAFGNWHPVGKWAVGSMQGQAGYPHGPHIRGTDTRDVNEEGWGW